MNPVKQLTRFGQSPWLDYIQRALFTSDEFERMMAEDGICGVTSNPAILAKAMDHPEYAEAIAHLRPLHLHTSGLYEALVLEDIHLACDTLRAAWESSNYQDGYVSLEVPPDLAWNTEATVAEALRLWRRIDRPNAMIKVPATVPGLEAIRKLTAAGVNVNATLIFSPKRYRQVAVAWKAGMEQRIDEGKPLQGMASVASFFVSRIETLADKLLDEISHSHPKAMTLKGRIAVASARHAYAHYRSLRRSDSWQRLIEAGARPQRLLWASTSTKNPDYPDTKYVDELVGEETVNTLPPATLAAYRDHGHPAPRLQAEQLREAERTLAAFADLGFDFERMAEQLEQEGVEKFQRAWDQLMEALEQS